MALKKKKTLTLKLISFLKSHISLQILEELQRPSIHLAWE